MVITLVGADSVFPIMWTHDERPAGYGFEIGKLALQRAGYKVVTKTCPWARCLSISEEGLGVIMAISKTSEREKLYYFTEPMQETDIILVSKRSKLFKFSEIKDLKNKKIGNLRRSSFGDDFEKIKRVVSFIEDDSAVRRLMMVQSERLDAGVFTVKDFEVALLKSGYKRSDFHVYEKTLAKDVMFFAVGKKHPYATEIVQGMNLQLLLMRKEGYIDRLINEASARINR